METDLKHIEIKNFKSCKDTKIDFGNFNVLIGANGSGKSNIIEAFRFLKEIISPGTINPFIKYGGYRNLVWKNDETLPISFSLVFVSEEKKVKFKLEYSITISGYAGSLEVIQEEIKGKIKDKEIGILRKGNEIIFKKEDVEIGMNAKTYFAPVLSSLVYYFFDIFGFVENISVITSFSSTNKEYEKYINCVGKKPDEKIKKFVVEIFRQPSVLSIRSQIPITLSYLFFLCRQNINNIFVFNLIPQMMKPPSKLESKELDYNGENLQSILFNIFSEHQGWPEDITERLKILFPHISKMSVISTPDGRIMLKVIENGIELQMNSLSDGFFKIIAVLALCFEYKKTGADLGMQMEPVAKLKELLRKHSGHVIIIEEIENFIHPEAIEIVMEALKSSGNTIILTTHSPVVLNMTEIEDILFVEKQVDETVTERHKDAKKLKEELIKKISVGEGWLLGALK
ncbi:MAG: hypothetical protein BWK75_06750 [Candidatus Altiarchaeales archaeon A3]|nr:MAG: hypothetical protein BWK75_06750 [Candidatus Altiarchaeales archaeon A3]